MRNLLALLATATLVFVGLGWYLGWYQISSVPAETPGHRSVTIDINAKKIGADFKTGSDKLQHVIDDAAKEDPHAGKEVPPVNKASR